ncbi:MAG: hypothetical protein U0640_12055 [Phycisphaerales bacterium]
MSIARKSPECSLTTISRWAITAMLASAGCAVAQDSVSTNANGGNGLPGDALSAFATGQPFQRANFVVDLTNFETSWGTPFGIGPVLKSVKVSDGRFNAVNGPSTISTTIRSTSLTSTNYARWTIAGAGLNPTQNNTAGNTPVALSGNVAQFGVGVLDFDEQVSGALLVFTNSVSSASVSYDPANPSRIHVTRTVCALNGPSAASDTSQFGLGGVEATGSVLIRADGFQTASASPLLNDNYFYITAPTRLETTVNTISNAGGSNASNWLVVRNTVTVSPPALVPADAGNGVSTLIGSNFVGDLLVRPVTSTLSTVNTHRPGTTDHRGAPTFSGATLWPNTRGSGAILSRSTGGGGKTDSISVFGLSTTNTIVNARTLTLPASVSDTCDGFNWPISGGDFRQFDSQAAFRGGTGPAAIGKDLAGMGLVAATVYNGSQPGGNTNNPFNAIVVGRFDPNNANAPSWTAAAWVDGANDDGKDILGDFGVDGAPNTNDAGEGDGSINQLDATIGRLVPLSNGPSGYVGPSLSAPAFDSAGNVYFIASVALKKLAGSMVLEERTVALVRGVLDASTPCYRLELVLAQGDVFAGQNSQRNYKVSWLGLADEDSISSASMWSTNVSSSPWANDIAANALPASAPQHLGGLAVSARVVYDVNQDGQYQDPTSPQGVQTSVDEAYNAVLYIGNVTQIPTGPICDSIDFNNDTSLFDPQDIDAFLSVYSEGPCVPPSATCNDIDFNNDGSLFDPCDIDAFLLVFSEGPCTACGV